MFSTLRQVLAIVDRRTRRGLLVLAGCSLIGTVLEMIGTGLFLPLMQIFVAPERLTAMPVVGPLFMPLMSMDQSRVLVGAVLVMLGFFTVKNAAVAVLKWHERKFIYNAEAEFQLRLFSAYMTRPWLEQVYMNSADVSRNLMRSVPVVFIRVLMPAVEIMSESLLALGAMLALLLVEPMATLLAVATTGTVMGAFFVIIRMRMSRWGKEIEEHTARCFQWINQGVGGLKQAKVLGREAFFVERFKEAGEQAAHYSHLMMMMTQFPRLLGEVATLMTLVLVVVFLLVLRDRPPADALPVLGVLAAAAFRVLPSVNRIVHSAAMIRSGVAAVSNVYDDLVGDLLRRGRPPRSDSAPLTLDRELRAANVSFQYPRSATPALVQVNLTVRRGEIVALVGRSGSGKTTLVDLLLGLMEPSEGAVLADGRDIRENTRSWQSRIAYVPQTIALFDDTLARNVAFALPEGELDRNRVIKALERAQMAEVVTGLPEGLDTRLGENGARLSGGQRQRIGIARALYDDHDLLVLDEATSALDQETESKMTQTFDALRGETTVIVVAHRLSTVRRCDRVVLMDAGRVVAEGTFDQLRQDSPQFARLVSSGDLEEAQE